MKKIKLGVLMSLLVCKTISAQNTFSLDPTTSSLTNYVNVGVSQATGVPNINFPVYQLESSKNGFPVNLTLTYHVYNAKPGMPVGDIGLGWSLFTSGMISREVRGSDIDEIKDWTDINEEESDMFYYNIPGHSGKFMIYKDPDTGTLILNNVTGEKLKIEYIRDISSTKLVINSFTITDEKGIIYLFQEFNLGLYNTPTKKTNYKTAFFLNKITDANGIELINYQYDKKLKYLGTSNILSFQRCKINNITTTKGKIKLVYNYDAYYEDNENVDPYTLNNISLHDKSGRFLSKYNFIYSTVSIPDKNEYNGVAIKRVLEAIKKVDRDLVVYEETSFQYDNEGSSTEYGAAGYGYGNLSCETNSTQFSNPKNNTLGLLKKIIFPTKGYVVYDFEANTVYADKSTHNYSSSNSIIDPEVQYYGNDSISYDTHNSTTYQFQVSGTPGTYYPVYVTNNWEEDYAPTDTHGNPILLKHAVKNSSNVLISPSASQCPSYSMPLYKLTPGTYTIAITQGGGNGNFVISGLKSLPLPYKNTDPVTAGARVKMIQSFDTDGTLVKTKKFEYNSFAEPTSSSGYSFYSEGCSLSLGDSFILYKNVKEIDISGNTNNGYTNYYFKTPEDYRVPNMNYYSYYNIVYNGILEKKEIYNQQNQIVESSDFEYNMQEIPNTKQYGQCSFETKPSWLQYVKETNKTYLNQLTYKTISEKTFSQDNFQESLSRITAQDGSITETTTKYASDLGNSRLLNANMISVPLQIETKTDGTVMTKVTTKYDNISHFYSTSLESTDLNQTAETQMTLDLYDSNGNLVQTTDKAGNSVTTIWGYNQTLPIAQIVGAKYSDISSLSAVTAAVNASNADAADPANEAGLLTALNNLRTASQLQEYTITVNTYDPLIGITNNISSNGIKKSYEYDNAGRLLKVKNNSGQVLNENQYNYKH